MNLILDTPFPLSAEAAKIRDDLNSAWAEVQSRRAEYTAEVSRLAAVPVDEFDEAHVDAVRRNERKLLGIARSELLILREAEKTWPEVYGRDRKASIDEAAKVLTQIVQEIQEKLIGLGFPTDPPPGMLFMAINHLPNAHPRAVDDRRHLSRLEETPARPPVDFDAMIREREEELRAAVSA